MNCVVTVTEGPAAGLSAPVRVGVFRIGSDASCDLVLPGEPERTAVVRSRDGSRTVYNRSQQPLRVGRKTVAPDESAPWRMGQEVWLPSGTRLRLAEESEAPKPTPAASARLAEPLDGDDEPVAERRSSTKTAVISVAVVALALFVFDDGPGLSRSAERMGDLMQRLERVADRRLQLARNAIQRGRIAELRGEPSEASVNYTAARELLQAPGPMGAALNGLNNDTKQFVQGRLSLLGESG